MKTYTKEWYQVTETKRIAIWLNTADQGEIQLLPILDDSIPELPGEVITDATEYIADKTERGNRVRVVPVRNYFPVYEEYEADALIAPMQSIENDVQNTLINRMRVFESLPERIKDMIPDKRLFVLGYAPAEVKRQVLEYCNSLPDYREKIKRTEEENERILGKTTLARQTEEDDLVSLAQFLEYNPIAEVIQEDENLKIRFSSGESIVLVKGAVISKEKEFAGGMATEYELYETNGGYEIHCCQ